MKRKTWMRHLLEVVADKTGKYQLLCANCNWIKRSENGEYPNRIGKETA